MTIGATEQSSATFDEDTMLAQRFLDGDAAAFDRLYERYYDKVYAIAKGVLLDADDAVDAVQETFTLIYRNLARFNQHSRLGTWIFRIAVNTAIQNSRRLKNKKRNLPLSEAAERQAPEMPLPSDEEAKVERALAELKPPDRAILTLFYWDDLSLKDIGASIGCDPNAAKTRLYRARERFKEVYERLDS